MLQASRAIQIQEEAPDMEKAMAEMRHLHGREAFAQASARAATAHLEGDVKHFEFWRAVAIKLKQEGEGRLGDVKARPI